MTAGWIAGRVARAAFNVFVVVTFLFFIMRVLPQDPAAILLGSEVTPENLARLREQLGLNEPVLVQYREYLWSLLQLDLGPALLGSYDLVSVVLTRAPTTLALAGNGILVASILGLLGGAALAYTSARWIEATIRVVATAALATPSFLIGVFVLFVAYLATPVPSYVRSLYWGMAIFSLGTHVGGYMVFAAAELFDGLRNEPFVDLATAKGLKSRRIVMIHSLRNALVPLLTLAVTYFALMVGNAVLIEALFLQPGLGSMVYAGVLRADYPLVQAGGLAIAVLVIGSYFVADIVAPLIDPRIAQEA